MNEFEQQNGFEQQSRPQNGFGEQSPDRQDGFEAQDNAATQNDFAERSSEQANDFAPQGAPCSAGAFRPQSDPYTYYSGGAPTPMSKPKKKHRRVAGIVAVALCCALLGGAAGVGGVLLTQHLQSNATVEPTEDDGNISHILMGLRESSVIDTVDIDTGKLLTASEVYAANVNSTVGITTSITTNYWGYQSTSAASGSGFIISDDGYILTNYHVIEDSDSISVSMYNGDTYEATLIGYDESNDIAVLDIDAMGLAPVVIGDSDNLNVGDGVVAIGNPLGELTFSLTSGTISAKDREITMSNGVTMDLMQTDCAINSGNSGGPLFNLYGEVIGVTNAKYSGSSGSSASIDNIGFAIPINSVMGIVKSIIENGYISKPYVGISVRNVSEETQRYGVPAGAAVYSVTEGSPAEQAGLQTGDVITAVNGTEMTSNELVAFVSSSSVGDQAVFSVYRQGATLEITVTVGEQIQSALANEETDTNEQQYPFSWGYGGRP